MISTNCFVSRRSFCQLAASALVGTALDAEGESGYAAVQNCPIEWGYRSTKQYRDPFTEVELDVIFNTPSGLEQRVPAFWAGGDRWLVRYAPPEAGDYKFHSICSDTSNKSLHSHNGTLHVTAYAGDNALYRHGAARVAKDRRHFEYGDGTPFFWLGDTWWMGFSKRLRWPDGFQTLTADRVRKGFSVVQIVAGLYPDMEPYDPRGANEAGFAWEQGYARINPAYFEMADLRIEHLAEHGIMPCIVGCWGYFLPQMGIQKMKQHWRYLIARWGAYPVFWCLAGEGTMPFYLSKTPKEDAEAQKHGWSEMARFVRATDPYRHPITIHPSHSARETVDDAALLDFDMLQTGHDDRKSAPNTVDSVIRSRESSPAMPVLVGEVCYEGIQEASRQEVQRFMFWAAILSGAGGHTYGANGIWQVNTREKPYGLSPHGHSWGGPPWDQAAQLPGSAQLGIGRSLLTRYSWWKLEPRAEIVSPRWTRDNYWQPFAAHIPDEVVIAYSPSGMKALQFDNLDRVRYRGFFFNPSDGTEVSFGTVEPDANGGYKAPEFPIFRDWVVVLDSKG
jgi:hypothetical protein